MTDAGSAVDNLTDFCRKEHGELLNGLDNETAWSKEAELGYGNQVVSAAHDDRTVLELVQNARDAIIDGDDDGRVAVIVGPESVMVANTGSPFRLDDEEVFSAVTSLGRSAKAQDSGSIGEKGVGLKSVLQLSEQFHIHSEVGGDALSAHFSRTRPARMILSTYADLLTDPNFTARLPDGDDSLDDVFRAVAQEHGSGLPEYLDAGEVYTQLLAGEQEAPSPRAILSDLPRLSLFRYPFPDGGSADDSPLRTTLVRGRESPQMSSDRFGERLDSWLRNASGSFTTVVELDYIDDDWRNLLGRIDEALAGVGSDALSTFRDNRSSIQSDRQEFKQSRQEELWEECTSISPETLILLGHIGQVDLLRLDRDREGTLHVDERREISINRGDGTSISSEPTIARRPVTYKVISSELAPQCGKMMTRTFRQYTRSDIAFTEDDSNDEIRDELHVLVENPSTNAEWVPDNKPLYLYYPIDEAETPFPFVVHAPFQVGFDRQSLAESDQNRRILKLLPDLVTNVAIDLASSDTSESDATNPFAQWMPWLMTPVTSPEQGADPGAVQHAVDDTLTALQNAPIVPEDNGGLRQPTETLIDPARLSAFEPLREHSPAVPLPAADSVACGRAWKKKLNENSSGGRNKRSEDESSAFRAWAAAVGLTTVLDRPREDEDGRGSIDILCDGWRAADLAEDQWAIRVSEPDHAEQYFTSILGILQSASEGDGLDVGDGTDAKEAAKMLGNERVPLLPAEAHKETDEDTEKPAVTHLVRARSRSLSGGHVGAARSERIVFRRAAANGKSERSSIGDLPTPPKALPVFVVPFRSDWSGALEGYNRDWGTRNLDSPTAFYRRIAAEAGGFSGESRSDPEVVTFVADLYDTVTETQVAEWLQPKPNHHRQYQDVEKTIRGSKSYKSPTDYDDYLERRYTQRIMLPVAGACTPAAKTDGTSDNEGDEKHRKEAERLTFGSEWATEFKRAAAELEAEEPVGGDEVDEEAKPHRYRRWAAAIKLASAARDDESYELAPPDDGYWDTVFGTEATADDLVHRLDTLIHLGVQIGPRVTWRWALPKQANSNRTVEAIPSSNARSLSRGNLLDDDDCDDGNKFTPPIDLLETYVDIIWNSDNNPAFSAGHSRTCRQEWLGSEIEGWVCEEDVFLPTWWYFPDLVDADGEAALQHRDSALLVWPELADSLIETAWVCSRRHQFKEPKATVPSLGVTQLASRDIWPAEPTSEAGSAGDRLVVQNDERFKTRHLLLNESDTARGAAQYLPRAKVDKLDERLASAVATVTGADPETATDAVEAVDVAAALRVFGTVPLTDLTPPMAAKRLEWFLRHFSDESPEGGTWMLEATAGWSTRSMSVPVNALLRQLVNDRNLSRRIEGREPKRRWIRRDLANLGTRIPVTKGDISMVLRIDGGSRSETAIDVKVFTEPLSKFARGRLANDGQCFVERPADEVEVAYVLGDEDEPSDFGIVRHNDPPTPQSVHDAESELGGERLESLHARLWERREYLLAACLENVTGIDLEDANRKLTAVFENPIGVVKHDRTKDRRNSAEWEPSRGDGGPRIALFASSLEHVDASDNKRPEIPTYLAADGLVQVLDQFDLRDTFETVLFKDTNALEDEYRNTLNDVRREVEDLRVRRIERTHEALASLLSTLHSDTSLTPPDAINVDPQATIETLRERGDDSSIDRDSGPSKATMEAVAANPLLKSWLNTLSDAGITSRGHAVDCLCAAATDDHADRLQIVLRLDRLNVVNADALADSGGIWQQLHTWPNDIRYRAVESAVRAVDRSRLFFEYLAEHDDEGEDGMSRAVRDVPSALEPRSPLTRTTRFAPELNDLPNDLRDRRIGEYPLVERDSTAVTALHDAAGTWVEREYESLCEMDVVYEDSTIREFYDALADAVRTTDAPDDAVKKVFDAFQTQTSWSAQTGATRADRTAEWIGEEDESLRAIAEQFVGASASSTATGGSPSIDDSTGGGYDHVNAQIDVRGRDGELICLERAWNRFCEADHEARSRILEALETWRSHDRWRLKSMDAAAATAGAEFGTDIDSDVLLALLTGDLDGGRRERAAFHALFDTSSERGPGFDLIDPFAAIPDDMDPSAWSSEWMRRVEVKAVASSRLRNGRIKLTGNELRMAFREGPRSEGADARRYLVRLVGFPTDWREREVGASDIRLLDIENVVAFAGLDAASAPILEKLRGGSFYVTFSTDT